MYAQLEASFARWKTNVKRLAFSVLAGTALSLAACDKPSPAAAPTPMRTISGHITETVPTETIAVAGARVTIDYGPNAGTVATADGDGRYSIPNVTESIIRLHASAPGYLDRAGSLELTADRVLDFQLAPEPRTIIDNLAGTIQNCNGDVYIVCFSHRFHVHHPGPIDLVLTTSGKSVSIQVQNYDATRQGVPQWVWHQSPGTMTWTFYASLPAIYELRLVSRILEPLSFTARLTHPN